MMVSAVASITRLATSISAAEVSLAIGAPSAATVALFSAIIRKIRSRNGDLDSGASVENRYHIRCNKHTMTSTTAL